MDVECQCGAVKLRTPIPKPLELYICHCTECRKQSSSAFGMSAVFPAAPLFPLSDDLKTKLGQWSRPADSGRTVDCYFCKECGARVVHRIRGTDGVEWPTVTVKAGLVKGLDLRTAKHIFTKSAVFPIPDGAECYEGEPPWRD
jgi:hypothetical protein